MKKFILALMLVLVGLALGGAIYPIWRFTVDTLGAMLKTQHEAHQKLVWESQNLLDKTAGVVVQFCTNNQGTKCEVTYIE